MTLQWQYQIRIYLGDRFAELARRDPDDPEIASLTPILIKHHAAMKCQFDAFADYVAEAEKLGPENYPLYEWTKAIYYMTFGEYDFLSIIEASGEKTVIAALAVANLPVKLRITKQHQLRHPE